MRWREENHGKTEVVCCGAAIDPDQIMNRHLSLPHTFVREAVREMTGVTREQIRQYLEDAVESQTE